MVLRLWLSLQARTSCNPPLLLLNMVNAKLLHLVQGIARELLVQSLFAQRVGQRFHQRRAMLAGAERLLGILNDTCALICAHLCSIYVTQCHS